MFNALVIGGAGFVGSNLCEALVKDGAKVVSLDNYSTGFAQNHVKGVEYIMGDCRFINIAPFTDKFDAVFHLGEFPRVELSVDMPMEAMNGIVATIAPVIDFCHKTGAKLIYSGSSTRFGDAESPYSICKESNASLVDRLCGYLGMRYAITYFYNVYGKNEIKQGPYSTLIGRIVEAKNNSGQIVVTSPGTQRRRFTAVEDICAGLIMVAKKGQGDGYGIGSETEYSILDVVQLSGCDYVMGPTKSGNRLSADLKTEKIKKLGWREMHSLEDYLREMV
jgi:UDP-glucose 4-epimerase